MTSHSGNKEEGIFFRFQHKATEKENSGKNLRKTKEKERAKNQAVTRRRGPGGARRRPRQAGRVLRGLQPCPIRFRAGDVSVSFRGRPASGPATGEGRRRPRVDPIGIPSRSRHGHQGHDGDHPSHPLVHDQPPARPQAVRARGHPPQSRQRLQGGVEAEARQGVRGEGPQLHLRVPHPLRIRSHLRQPPDSLVAASAM
ncbi:hypothetical protein VPH35_048882 [Triticum aestivum]|uniref:Uncharacterized protein n=2 Tax=Triticum aestivum TaxID=4565 RepID=A0A077RU97_WHEAT|nr:unnamed protein product [Triticum aestivum]